VIAENGRTGDPQNPKNGQGPKKLQRGRKKRAFDRESVAVRYRQTKKLDQPQTFGTDKKSAWDKSGAKIFGGKKTEEFGHVLAIPDDLDRSSKGPKDKEKDMRTADLEENGEKYSIGKTCISGRTPFSQRHSQLCTGGISVSRNSNHQKKKIQH